MDLHVSTLKEFTPQTGHRQDWDETVNRLRQFLASHGLTEHRQTEQIILRFLQRGAALHLRRPEEHPLRLTMTLVLEETRRWYGKISSSAAEAAQNGPVVFPLTLLADANLASWPEFFLNEEEIPPEFLQSSGQTEFQAGPEIRLSSMAPRPVDLPPLFEDGEITLEKLERVPLFVILGAILAAASALMVLLNFY